MKKVAIGCDVGNNSVKVKTSNCESFSITTKEGQKNIPAAIT